jgi:hypothetical protein
MGARQTQGRTPRVPQQTPSRPAVFKVLEVVHELVRSGRQATQRDVYYKVRHPEVCRARPQLAAPFAPVAPPASSSRPHPTLVPPAAGRHCPVPQRH